ncbi:MAG: hypothetical protein J5892_02525 [Bacilli bacterium]|nr:hypothetical protein [Bacilli bacterium]
MKKVVKINRENLAKRLVGTVALATTTIAVTLSTACTEEEMNQAIDTLNQMTTEQNTNAETTHDIDIPMDTDKPEETPEDNTNVDEPVEEPEENQVEEVNPRDMQAVYGLDFEVPIYTEEEVEQAKYNLQHNYSDYNGIFEEDYSEEQILAIKDDYYIANQDFWYQLYNMTKDFKCKTARIDGKGYYYLEDKDWYIEVQKDAIRIYGDIYGSGYTFISHGNTSGDEKDIPNTIKMQRICVGPGAYVLIADKGYYKSIQEYFEERGEIFDSSKDLEELEHYGFHNNELTAEYTGYLNGNSLTLEQ